MGDVVANGPSGVDPTENVKDMLDSATGRLDDLRAMEAQHVIEIRQLTAGFQSELRHAETERINAIRAVDVGAVQRAAEVAALQAATLAATVATSAEAMRAQVAAAATAAQTSLAGALVPIQKDISDLRQSQWQGVGEKTQVVETRNEGAAKGANIGLWIAAAAAVSAFFLGLGGIVITLIITLS